MLPTWVNIPGTEQGGLGWRWIYWDKRYSSERTSYEDICILPLCLILRYYGLPFKVGIAVYRKKKKNLRSLTKLIVGTHDLCERRDRICSSLPLVRAGLGSITAWVCCQDNTHRAKLWTWAWLSLTTWRQVRLVLPTLKRASILLAPKLARGFDISFNSLNKSLSSVQHSHINAGQNLHQGHKQEPMLKHLRT